MKLPTMASYSSQKKIQTCDLEFPGNLMLRPSPHPKSIQATQVLSQVSKHMEFSPVSGPLFTQAEYPVPSVQIFISTQTTTPNNQVRLSRLTLLLLSQRNPRTLPVTAYLYIWFRSKEEKGVSFGPLEFFWFCFCFLFVCVGSSLLRVGFLQLRLIAVCRLLIAVASLVAEHGLQAHRLQQLWHVGSVVVAHGLSSSTVCGIFPDQGSKPVSPALAGGFLTTAPPGKPGPLEFETPLETPKQLSSAQVTMWMR